MYSFYDTKKQFLKKTGKNSYCVSAIICTVDRFEEIKLCLKSLAGQSFKNFEVIIVDGRSDGSLENVCRFYSDKLNIKRVKVYKRNLAFSRNVGIRYMSSGIAAFIDDDAEAGKNWVENICNIFTADNKIVGIAGKIYTSDKSYLPSFAEVLFDYGKDKKNVDTITGTDMILNIRKIKKIQGFRKNIFNENFKFAGEETDACLNIRKYKGVLTYYPEVFVFHKFETKLSKFIYKQFSYGIGDYLVNGNPEYKDLNFIKSYTWPFKSVFLIPFFPLTITFTVLSKTLKFALNSGINWIPAVLVRESSYSAGIYFAYLTSLFK